MNRISLDQLNRAVLAGLVNTRFQVQAGAAAPVELELVEVTPARVTEKAGSPGSVSESFALVFQGPKEVFLKQKIHLFTHEQLGTFDLFIVPIGQTPDGIRYEAVFNRLVSVQSER